MTLAIVKPDHLGDLILSQPAIQALIDYDKDVVLHVQEKNMRLARYLFPETEIREIHFKHLARNKAGNSKDAINQLRSFEKIMFLRKDHLLNYEILGSVLADSEFVDNPGIHVAKSQQNWIYKNLDLNYGIYEKWCGVFKPWPAMLNRVCFALGSGFPTNKWPTYNWIQLAVMLKNIGTQEVVLLHGNSELEEAKFIEERVNRVLRVVRLNGQSSEISESAEIIGNCDVSIGADGGSNHFSSLFTANLSIFTSSRPSIWAPLGIGNRVISLNLGCVQNCINFHELALNPCLTRECSFVLKPQAVIESIMTHSSNLRNQKSIEIGKFQFTLTNSLLWTNS